MFRSALLSLAFLAVFLALNDPHVIVLSTLGNVAWYPATGLCLALMLGVSPWYAIAVCVGNVLAGALIYQQPLLSYGETLGALGMSICYGAAAYILRGPLKIDPGLRHRRDVMRYVFVTGVAAVGATVIGVACLAGDHSIAWTGFWPASVSWFFGDAIGLLGVAPFLLIHVLPWIRRHLSTTFSEAESSFERDPQGMLTRTPGSMFEALSQGAALVVALWMIFGTHLRDRELTYLSFVPIIWMSMRQGIRRVAVGLLLFNFGIVVAMHIYPPTPSLLARVSLLMLAVSAVGLITGSAVTERHRVAVALQQQTVYLNSLIENSPLGLVVIDRRGQIELTNPAFEKMLMYRQPEGGHDPNRMFLSEEENSEFREHISRVLAGETLHTKVRRRRSDGKVLDLEVHSVPLVIDGQVQGAFTIYNDISEQVRASEAERKHAESLSELVNELQVRTRQMALLNEMGDLLECCSDIPEACAVVSQSVQKLFPEAGSGALYLFRSSRNLVESAVRWGKAQSEPVFPPHSCWGLRRGRPHWSESADGGIRCQHLAEDSKFQSLCVPMVAQGDTLGVLQLDFADGAELKGGTETFHDSHGRLATSVTGQVALSLASLRLRETLRDQSIRDALTGLFNRRFMEECLERELQRAGRKQHPVSVLFLDLDQFKRFNDTFGHDAGDLVLRSLADLLRNFFRSADVCCRYGGEEFGIIMPESSSEDSARRANALREEVKKLKLEHRSQTLGLVTVSIGIAAFPEHGTSAEQLLHVADQCLYRSKAAGRDTVTVASLPAIRP